MALIDRRHDVGDYTRLPAAGRARTSGATRVVGVGLKIQQGEEGKKTLQKGRECVTNVWGLGWNLTGCQRDSVHAMIHSSCDGLRAIVVFVYRNLTS